jgi:hypothetical protein
MNVKADLVEEKTIMEAINKRMNYFDGLVESSQTLVEQSSKLLEVTKSFRQALTVARNEIKMDFSDD